MFPSRLQAGARRAAEAVVIPLAAIGVTPNTLTVVGFVFNVVTAAIIATGHLTAGAIMLFISAIFDMFDGALARVAGSQSDFGAFLDSLLDRYAEGVILLALVYVFTIHHRTALVLLAYVVAVGSLLISYARARAEGLALEARVGIAPRPERVIILGLGLLFNDVTAAIALVILAILTHFTAMQRLYHVWRQTSGSGEPQTQVASAPEESHPRSAEHSTVVN